MVGANVYLTPPGTQAWAGVNNISVKMCKLDEVAVLNILVDHPEIERSTNTGLPKPLFLGGAGAVLLVRLLLLLYCDFYFYGTLRLF